jgi:hypothetical protein
MSTKIRLHLIQEPKTNTDATDTTATEGEIRIRHNFATPLVVAFGLEGAPAPEDAHKSENTLGKLAEFVTRHKALIQSANKKAEEVEAAMKVVEEGADPDLVQNFEGYFEEFPAKLAELYRAKQTLKADIGLLDELLKQECPEAEEEQFGVFMDPLVSTIVEGATLLRDQDRAFDKLCLPDVYNDAEEAEARKALDLVLDKLQDRTQPTTSEKRGRKAASEEEKAAKKSARKEAEKAAKAAAKAEKEAREAEEAERLLGALMQFLSEGKQKPFRSSYTRKPNKGCQCEDGDCSCER